ncbi:hypothetical protein JAAARDRAFT_125431, partial [Jaapia argillacea MUCL 33604]
SLAAHQCDVRVKQLLSIPSQFASVHSPKSADIPRFSSQYIHLYNLVWLILNDLIVGAAVGSFLYENNQLLAPILAHGFTLLTHSLTAALHWLDDWPAGLKLNTELSRFYSNLLVALVSFWAGLLERAIPYIPFAIRIIAITGCCGMTIINCLLLDALSLLTVHVRICYLLSVAIYHRLLQAAHSLWHLFQGRRYNVLRGRIDHWDYDLDQLLLGTMLFTHVAFLSPTIVTYYALFATCQMTLVLVRGGLETFLIFMNHFPLFTLMLHLKDSWRIPGESAPPPCASDETYFPSGAVHFDVPSQPSRPLILKVSLIGIDRMLFLRLYLERTHTLASRLSEFWCVASQ